MYVIKFNLIIQVLISSINELVTHFPTPCEGFILRSKEIIFYKEQSFKTDDPIDTWIIKISKSISKTVYNKITYL